MGIELVIKCARCNAELDVTPPLLFKHPILEVTVFSCTCKDSEILPDNKRLEKDG